MKLSECLEYIVDSSYVLVTDGEFQDLEQCTRIRGRQALTFLENAKYADMLQNEDISCVICKPGMERLVPDRVQGRIVTDKPKAAFFRIHNALWEKREQSQQSRFPTIIDPTARISPLAYVAPYNVVIGKNVIVDPFAVIIEGVTLGDDVEIGAGTVFTAGGFAQVALDEERAFPIKCAGTTHIGKSVRIMANCTIEQGLLQNDKTVIGDCSMVGTRSGIGHGTVIGKRATLTGAHVICGNCVIGNRVYMGVHATVSNGLTIGDDARISLGSVVTKDVPAGETVTGNFAINHQRFMKNLKESIREDS